MGGEASAGILLIVVAVLAMIVAHSGWACGYHGFFHRWLAWPPVAKLDFTIPLRLGREGDSMLLRMEHALVPWNSYPIVPLFGFANAGVATAARQRPLPTRARTRCAGESLGVT